MNDVETLKREKKKSQTLLSKDNTHSFEEGRAHASRSLAHRIFFTLDTENKGVLNAQSLIKKLELMGLRRDDRRLRDFFDALNVHESHEITFSKFEQCLGNSSLLIDRGLKGNLIIPRFSEFTDTIRSIYDEVRTTKDGRVANYIPQLANVDPNKFAISVCTIDGQRFSIGDFEETFSIQSTSKPITYCLALEEHGEAKVHSHVGREPSGVSFNALTLNNQRLPHNPMINSGAIMCCSLIKQELTPADRFDYVLEKWSQLSGGVRPIFNNSVYLSEKATADRNFALAYFMRENKAFPQGININEILDYYFQCCSMELSTDQFAVVASTLANGGICPMTGSRVLSNQSVKNCLSLMASCGMYDYSGEFAFSIGLPAKSGVGGGLLLVVPNLMGICIWSPLLDSTGNSIKGLAVCRKLIQKYNLHNFDSLIGSKDSKADLRLQKNQTKMDGVMALCWAAYQGDLLEVQQLIARGVNANEGDYDGRTPLHLACSEGHLAVAQFLIAQGAKIEVEDRWKGTPLQDAQRGGHQNVEQYIHDLLGSARSLN